MAATTIPTARPTALSRLVGVAYFGIVFTGIFAEFVVRGQLVVAGDAAATAANIAGSPGLFATGIGADVVMIALDVIVGLGLYRLLAPYDRRLARVATGARLIQAGILAANMFTLAPALGLAQDAVSTGSSAIAARALQAVEAHALGYDIGLIAFGVSCLALAKLLADHHLVPTWLAIGMAATGAVYLLGSFAAVFAPSLNTAIDPLYLIAMVVEPAFAARLFSRGIPTPSVTAVRPVAVAA
ncbi:MAG: DUF4386 domain-containing protein [Actinomycetota bacterium]